LSELSEYEKGFLEAGIDFEGCVTVTRWKLPRNKYGYRPVVFVACSNPLIIGKVADICGCGGKLSTQYRKGCVSKQGIRINKNLYRYDLSRDEIDEILPQLELIDKHKQQALILEASSIIFKGQGGGGHRHLPEDFKRLEEIYKEIRWLNSGERV